jgi:Domain of unknown function (DUF5916)
VDKLPCATWFARADGLVLRRLAASYCSRVLASILIPVLSVLHGDPAPVYDGRAGHLAVQAPRVEADITVDGQLDEPTWAQAARLTGFSQFLPVDGLPAVDSTVVLVFYSKRAIYFGIRAYEAHGPVHVTLADRDKISSNDFVQIILDTSHDHRTAYVFGVNPLGIQADGILSEGMQSKASGLGAAASARDTVDFSTDYTWESRGHVTDYGYEVEVRIPFSSIRFTSGEQQWRLNIVRQVQHSGFQDTWAPARLAAASFLAQSGSLEGLQGLSRGMVLDVNPELTSTTNGNPGPNGWKYGVQPLHPGGNVRWGITDNLTLDGTVRPDFSQIESDVPQLSYDPRVALFFPEKRPFFLDGLEQFDTPGSLVYTRRIVQPDGAAKITGELAGASIGLLSAVDYSTASRTGQDHPYINILRAHREVGFGTTLGVIGTDREDGGLYNHVGGIDTRTVFGDIYSLRLQGVMSSTRSDSVRGLGGLWNALFERRGHHLRLTYAISGIDPHFVDEDGFISRPGIVNTTFDNAVIFYGKPNGLFESYTFDFANVTTWEYDHFKALHRGEDVRWHFSNTVALRGGWQLYGNIFVETYGYDPTLYQNYYIAKPTPTGIDTVKVDAAPRTGNLPNLDIITGFATPNWKHFDASVQILSGFDDNFYEWSSAWILFVNSTINWRPNDRARISLIYAQNQYVRRSDNTQVFVQRVPYLEVAYQLSRPIYVRFIGQYNSTWQANLRDDGRTNAPLLLRDPATGTFTPLSHYISNNVSSSFLFSYQPTPGTVFFLGYGGTYTEPWAFNFTGLTRQNDNFFIKITYLFHLGSGR